MKERPILFNGDMVRAILDGRKTQTRRVIREVPTYMHFKYCDGPKKGQPKPIMEWDLSGVWQDDDGRFWLDVQTDVDDNSHDELLCPQGLPGDRLYVKEATWIWCRKVPNGKTAAGRQKFRYLPHGSRSIFYVADHPQKPERESYAEPEMVWRYKTARFMPRWASRIALQIDNVSVHRLQEITSADAKCEGDHERSGMPEFYSRGELCHVDWFHHLWDSINAKRGFGWNTNPWVWALTFQRVDGGAL